MRGRWHDWRGHAGDRRPSIRRRCCAIRRRSARPGPTCCCCGRGSMGAADDAERGFVPVRIAVLTVSDTRGPADDRSGDTLVERLTAAGHVLADRAHRPRRAGGDRGAAAGLDRRPGRRRGDLDRRHRADRARRDGRGARGGLREGDPGLRDAVHHDLATRRSAPRRSRAGPAPGWRGAPTSSRCRARPAPAATPGTASSPRSSTIGTGPATSSRSCRGSRSTGGGSEPAKAPRRGQPEERQWTTPGTGSIDRWTRPATTSSAPPTPASRSSSTAATPARSAAPPTTASPRPATGSATGCSTSSATSR